MRKKKTPKRLFVTIEYEIDMVGWDDDVDWSDPEEVIREQYDCAGLEGLSNLCNMHNGTIVSVHTSKHAR